VKLRLPRHGRLWMPVLDHDGRRRRNAPPAKAIQLVTDRETGAISVRLFSDVTETYAAAREAYAPEMDAIGLDFGLSTSVVAARCARGCHSYGRVIECGLL
jgi:hypothetical protein